MVEIKSSKRAAQPTSAPSSAHPDVWDGLIPSGDLPARDTQPFLFDGREAEKLFSRFGVDQQPVPTLNGANAPVSNNAESSAPVVRVLPDLLAAVREHERTAALMPKRKRSSNGLKTVQRRRKGLVEHRMPDPDPTRAEQPNNLAQLSGMLLVARSVKRRRKSMRVHRTRNQGSGACECPSRDWRMAQSR
jgi:hypothetical protein